MEEELEEGAAEAREDIVDDGEQGVGAGCGTPWAEDGMRRLEDAYVDLKVCVR